MPGVVANSLELFATEPTPGEECLRPGGLHGDDHRFARCPRGFEGYIHSGGCWPGYLRFKARRRFREGSSQTARYCMAVVPLKANTCSSMSICLWISGRRPVELIVPRCSFLDEPATAAWGR
jgi:hypothetical protein